jgi:hypothetical protein
MGSPDQVHSFKVCIPVTGRWDEAGETTPPRLPLRIDDRVHQT